MLKANVKIWAIIMAMCLIGQFFWTAVPGWIEKGRQDAQVEIAKREEDRLASHEPGLEPIEKTPIATESVETGTIAIEKTNGNSEATEEEKEDEKSPPIVLIILAVVVIFIMIFALII